MIYDSDKIHDFLNGKLAGDELLEFEQVLQKDESLQKAVKDQQKLTAALKRMAFLEKKEIARSILEKHKNETANSPNSLIRFGKWVLAVAVLFMLIFAISKWYGNKEIEAPTSPIHIALAEEVFKDSPELQYGLFRNSPDLNDSEQLILQAYDAYTEGKYIELLEVLAEIQPTKPNYEDALLLKALAHYQQKDYDSALKFLNKGLQLPKNKQLALMQWYKSLLLLREGKIEESRLLLQQIAAGENRAAEKARQLLEKL